MTGHRDDINDTHNCMLVQYMHSSSQLFTVCPLPAVRHHALQSMVTSLLARANLSAIVCIQDAADPDDDLVHASSEFLNAVLLTSAAAVQMQVAILSVHPALSATNIDARMVAVNSIELHGDVRLAMPETMGAQTP